MKKIKKEKKLIWCIHICSKSKKAKTIFCETMSGSGGAFKVSRAQVAASSTAEKTITMMRQKMMLID